MHDLAIQIHVHVYIHIIMDDLATFLFKITCLHVAHHHMQVADPTSANVVSILDTGQKYPQEVQYSTCTRTLYTLQ